VKDETNVPLAPSDVQPAATSPGRPPAELVALPQWVVWRPEVVEGRRKPTKRPYLGVGIPAKTNEPTATFLTYDEAHRLAAEGFAGVGFVFTPGDPYVGVDLDHCRDPESKAIKPWAKAIIADLDSYTEVSPSGTGVHIIARGVLAPDARHRWKADDAGGEIEVYDRVRYFTFSSQVIDGLAEIKYQQAAIDQLIARAPSKTASALIDPPAPRLTDLSDQEVLQRIAGSRDGGAFQRLYIAGETRPNRSESDSDFELACILARHVGGDAERIERLMRASALSGRSKWERKDYLPRTINAAILNAGREAEVGTASAGAFTLLGWTDLLHQPVMPWLIDGVIPEQGVTVVFGDRESFKSFLILDWLAVIAGGIPDWFEIPVERHGPVVYVYAEGRFGFGQRVQALHGARRLDAVPDFIAIPHSVDVPNPEVAEALVPTIRARLGGRKPVAVAVDTLARNMPGRDENKQMDMNAFVAGCDRLRIAFDCQVIVVHHTNAQDRIKGSTNLPQAADTVLKLERGDGLTTTLSVDKQKDGAKLGPWTVTLRPEASSLVLHRVEAGQAPGKGRDPENPDKLAGPVEQALGVLARRGQEGLTYGEWVDAITAATGKGERTAKRYIETLTSDGVAMAEKRGDRDRYGLTRGGLDYSIREGWHVSPPGMSGK
jgi:putative DNA primase/helicase